MRALKRLIFWTTGLAFLTLAVVLAGVFLTRPCTEFHPDGSYDVAVILGGGMEPSGELHRSSTDRVEGAVALWKAGYVDKLHATGGRWSMQNPAAGAQMVAYAKSLGVPDEA